MENRVDIAFFIHDRVKTDATFNADSTDVIVLSSISTPNSVINLEHHSILIDSRTKIVIHQLHSQSLLPVSHIKMSCMVPRTLNLLKPTSLVRDRAVIQMLCHHMHIRIHSLLKALSQEGINLIQLLGSRPSSSPSDLPKHWVGNFNTLEVEHAYFSAARQARRWFEFDVHVGNAG